MVVGHPGSHGRGAALLVMVDRRAKCAIVQILPQIGMESCVMDLVA